MKFEILSHDQQTPGKRFYIPVKRRRRAPLVLLYIFLTLATMAVLVFGAGAWYLGPRYRAATLPGWELLPLWSSGVMAQNVEIWRDGRCYVQEPAARALEQAGEILRENEPDARIVYLDASPAKGGELSRHVTHRHGRDVDIMYIGKNLDNELVAGLPLLKAQGYGPSYDSTGRAGDLTFHARANMRLVRALIIQNRCPVLSILVEPHIRGWLLAAALEAGLPEAEQKRMAEVLRQKEPHDPPYAGHMHVRFDLPAR